MGSHTCVKSFRLGAGGGESRRVLSSCKAEGGVSWFSQARGQGPGLSKWPAAHHSVAPEEGLNWEAEQHIRKVMLTARWMWAGCTPAFKIMGNSFSRAAESKVWSSEILHHIQLQDSDAQLKTKRFKDLGGVNSRKGGYAVSSGTQHGKGSFRVKQARKKAES